jgi:hypothetical protein
MGPHVGDRAPHDRVQAVGAEEEVAALLAAVDGSCDNATFVLLDGYYLDAEAQFPPAPTGSMWGARSRTTTSWLAARKPIAALRPPIPPPTTITRMR